MIASLEAQMTGGDPPGNSTEAKKRQLSDDWDGHQEDDDIDIKDAYRRLMNKRRRAEEVTLSLRVVCKLF